MCERKILAFFRCILCMVFVSFLIVGVGYEVRAEDEKLIIQTRYVNDRLYDMISCSRVYLEWSDSSSSVHEYRLYSCEDSRCILLDTLESSCRSTVVSGLEESKEYKFKIEAVDGYDSVLWSSLCSVRTRDMTDGYFYEQSVLGGIWSNVLVTDRKASNCEINDYSIKGYFTPIKYNYSTDSNTLYIHVYMKYSGYGNRYFTIYNKDYSGVYSKERKVLITYKNLVNSSIKDFWSKSVKGSEWDFVRGCNFDTSVIIHTSGNSGQKYITAMIGDGGYVGDSYWFSSKGMMGLKKSDNSMCYQYNNDMIIKVPLQEQLIENRDSSRPPFETLDSFKSAIAHEFGHCLGLADGYSSVFDGVSIDRMSESDETGYYVSGKFRNIMSVASKDEGIEVMGNDIEMAVQAQGMSVSGSSYSWQSYKTYEYRYNNLVHKFKKSPVIRK